MTKDHRVGCGLNSSESPVLTSVVKAMKDKPLLLGGEWRTTATTREVRSPYNSELIPHFSVAAVAEVEEALSAAARAAGEMRELPRHHLAESLRAIADGIRARAEVFARTIATEAGKPIK